MKQHQCTYSKVCCCDILGMEPSEKCPVHSGYPEKPQCDICGRFLNVKHQVADHASDEYLAGLSELDRAKAIVAVRWRGADWRNDRERRVLTDHFALYKIASPDLPIFGHRPWVQLARIDCRYWGEGWTGTASLMELAEAKGWQLSRIDNNPFTVVLIHPQSWLDCVERTAATIHAAVLLACAEAAQREEPK